MYYRQSTINAGEERAIGDWELDRFLLQGLLLLRLQLIGALNLSMILRVRVEHSEFTIQSYKNNRVTFFHYMFTAALHG
jgi:hypothetical protein